MWAGTGIQQEPPSAVAEWSAMSFPMLGWRSSGRVRRLVMLSDRERGVDMRPAVVGVHGRGPLGAAASSGPGRPAVRSWLVPVVRGSSGRSFVSRAGIRCG